MASLYKMFFKSYEKVAENLEDFALTEQDHRTLRKMEWAVFEKIHGANFCVLSDGNELAYAKRKELLASDDDFFGYQTTMEALAPRLLRLAQAVRQDRQAAESVLVYGELFGGAYPHPAVPALPTTQVQTGVYYSPKVEFCIFDIAAVEAGQATYLPYPLLAQYCEACELPYSRALLVGKLQDALNFRIEFETTLPALLGYPPLPMPNFAEGVVIKPLQNQTIETAKGKIRPIFKRKISAFAETKYQQSTGNQSDLDAFNVLLQNALAMLTPNRYQSAVSKVGKVGKKEAAKIAQICTLIEHDILDSIEGRSAEIWQKTAKKQRVIFWDEIRLAIRRLVEANL